MAGMNCLILAAGMNTRLDNGIPKSMIKIGGETLMGRHLRQFSDLGVDNFCVVTGYRSEMLEEYFEGISEDLRKKITLIHNSEFERANGISLHKGKQWAMETEANKFFYTMADHYFSPDFMTESKTHYSDDEDLILIVDRPGKWNQHIDLADVTKVQSDADRIGMIGKSLTEYDLYDTGLFIAQQTIFEVLERAFENGGESISDGVQLLASESRAKIREVTGHFWSDVDTPEDLSMLRGKVS